MGDAALQTPADIAEEDVLRARLYDLLATLLRQPPDAGLLRQVAALESDDTPMGEAIGALSRLAKASTPEKAKREFHDLFVGLGRGELLPFASYYMTGFLNEKPLARLRAEMRRLRIERSPGETDPEDGIATLCEMMAGLILGRFAAPADLRTQKDFFAAHMAPWAGHFFADLEAAESSVLYAPVGTVGVRFMEIEREAFRLAEGESAPAPAAGGR